MLIKVNENTWINDSTIITIQWDINRVNGKKYVTIHTTYDEQYVISEHDDEYKVIIKYIQENTFPIATPDYHYTGVK